MEGAGQREAGHYQGPRAGLPPVQGETQRKIRTASTGNDLNFGRILKM